MIGLGLSIGLNAHRAGGGGTPTPTPTPPPVFTVQPAISDDGTPQVGELLTGSDGTITNGTISARAWLLAGTPIGGATGATYTPVATGAHTYRVTATGAGGSTSATSAGVTVAAATPTPDPTLAFGDYEATGTGLRFTGGAGRQNQGGPFGFPDSGNGSKYAILQNDGSIEHDIADLVVGQRYLLAMRTCGRNSTDWNSFTVTILGTVRGTFLPKSQDNWGELTLDFTATATSGVVRISNPTSGGDRTTAFDSLTLTKLVALPALPAAGTYLTGSPLYATAWKKVVPAYSGPLVKLTRGSGGSITIPNSGDRSAMAAFDDGSGIAEEFYDQVSGVLITGATPPSYIANNTMHGNPLATSIGTGQYYDLPAGLTVSRTDATIIMVQSSSGQATALMGLGTGGTFNNVSIYGGNPGMSVLGNSFGGAADVSAPASLDVVTYRMRSDYNPLRVGRKVSATGPFSAQSMSGGYINKSAFRPGDNNRNAMLAIYGTAQSDVDELQNYATAKSLHNIPDREDQIVFLGDSLTYSQYGDLPVSSLVEPNLNRRCFIVNLGLPGAGTPTLAELDALYDPRTFIRKQIAVNAMGANDINNGMSGATLWTTMSDWAARQKNRGWIVALATITPWTVWAPGSAEESARQAYNTALRNGAAALGILVADYAAATELSNAANTTYYHDGIHNKPAGYAVRETVVRPVLNTALAA